MNLGLWPAGMVYDLSFSRRLGPDGLCGHTDSRALKRSPVTFHWTPGFGMVLEGDTWKSAGPRTPKTLMVGRGPGRFSAEHSALSGSEMGHGRDMAEPRLTFSLIHI